MTVEYVEFVVEEPSMEAALRELLPRILGVVAFDVFAHQCKDDLLKRLPERMAGYAKRRKSDFWFRDHARIVVVVDRDDDDCEELKALMESIAAKAGVPTRSSSKGRAYSVINRIAIEELEAWYFGDWEAVLGAFPNVPPTIPSKSGFRDPDAIAGGTWEALERILQRAGYARGGFRKIESARRIAARMVPGRNRSASFQALVTALEELRAA